MVLIQEDAFFSASPPLFTESLACVAGDDHQAVVSCIRGLIRHHAKTEEAINMTSKIKGFMNVHIEARGFINDRYPRVKRIDFGRMWEEKGVWTVEGRVTLKTGLFSTIRRRRSWS